MRKRVLFITYWYPSKENPAVGIFVQEHAKAIVNAGNDVQVLHYDLKNGKVPLRWYIEKYIDENGIHVIRMKIFSLFWKAIYQLSPLFQYPLYKILRRKKFIDCSFNLIHSNVIFPAAFLGYKISKNNKIPHIITEHWSRLESFLSKSIYKTYAHRIIDNSAFLLPVSSLIADVLKKHTDHFDRILIVPNVVDDNVFYFQKKEPLPNDRIFFTVTAGWYKKKRFQKRPDLLFYALDEFCKSNRIEVTLNIIGDGDLINDLRKQSEKLSFMTVFHGALTKKQINEVLRETHFFLHASNFETFGIVVVEALKTGTPVIVSDLSTLRQFVNERNGLLVKNDKESWRLALQEAFDRKWDYKMIAEESRSIFSLLEIGRQINQIYDQVIHNLDFNRAQ